eukprot:12815425-Prorocentrum_lima.AAC.1
MAVWRNRHGVVARGRQVGGGWRVWGWKLHARSLQLKLHLQSSVTRDGFCCEAVFGGRWSSVFSFKMEIRDFSCW